MQPAPEEEEEKILNIVSLADVETADSQAAIFI
jgi:hypothetical protein